MEDKWFNHFGLILALGMVMANPPRSSWSVRVLRRYLVVAAAVAVIVGAAFAPALG